MLTGNYNFFNLLTLLLSVFLFDDAAIRRVLPTRLVTDHRALGPSRAATAIATAIAMIVVPIGIHRIWQLFAPSELPVIGSVSRAIEPLLIVNPYGLFANMTTARPEIVVEGSDDGQIWREYDFRYKPGELTRAPPWNIPHQHRLDWQMWFAALGISASSGGSSTSCVGYLRTALRVGVIDANRSPPRNMSGCPLRLSLAIRSVPQRASGGHAGGGPVSASNNVD
jgi:hypothetical protein